jgi:WD40 repeat protein
LTSIDVNLTSNDNIYSTTASHNQNLFIEFYSKEVWKNLKAKADYGQVLEMPRETLTQTRKQMESNEISAGDDVPANMYENSAADSSRNTSDANDSSQNEIEYEEVPAEGRSIPKSSIFHATFKASQEESNNSSGQQQSKALTLVNSQQFAITQKKTFLSMPKPQWHPPWKLYRVISGHLGWVRCIDVDPSNEWFVTGSTDRIIKIWDLASGTLKLSLTGHVSTVRGVCVSNRHPYLFSCGEDKQVKCWDLETNKVNNNPRDE